MAGLIGARVDASAVATAFDNPELPFSIQPSMFSQDLRFAWRTLVRRPAFAAVALITLALGIGANAAMFTVVRAVLLRPLPYPSPDALVRIVGMDRKTGEAGNLSPADFLDFARESRTLSRAGAHGWIGYFTIADHTGTPERIGGVNVTAGLFPALGTEFAVGRGFTADEDAANGPRVAILSHGFWQRRYGGDRAVVGTTIDINARPALVVGVLSESFRHVEANPERTADVFMPYQFDTVAPNRGGHFIRAVGRLRNGVSVDEAGVEMASIAARLEGDFPADNTDQGVLVTSLHESMVAAARPALLMLSAAVAFVLLMACANLANLLLAQGASRRAELAVRAAMGAGRQRLLRQLLTETVLLSSIGAAAGMALALAGTRLLTTFGAAGVPRAEDITVDGSVLMFGGALALAAALIAGLLPALQISRGDLHAAVREGGRGHGRASLHRPTRELLIAAQIAVALVLLAGAGVMVRSLWNLLDVDTGFQSAQVLTFETAVPTATYAEGEQIPFYERFYEAIREQPGVQSVGAINILPLSANYDSRGVQIEARPQPVGSAASSQARSISRDYFRAMGIPLVRGRAFTEQDVETRPRVVIISESMARQYWPGEDPIGQRVTFNSGIPLPEQREVGGPGSREVVGIVGDVKHLGLDEEEVPMFYTPQAQQPSYHTMAIVVRTASDSVALTASIRAALARLDRGVPLYRVRTLETVVRSTVAAPQLRAWLLGLFALLALSLSVVGVYGVVGYLVGQRTQEIGIRLALGANGGRVVGTMLVESLRPVVFGLVAGLALSLAAGRLMTGMLFGVAATDATIYAAVVLALLAAAVVATWIPARRVLHVDPMTTLRS